MTQEILLKEINESLENIKALQMATALHQDFEKVIEALVQSAKQGGCLYVAGNGGSAADAQHFVAELVVKLSRNRDPIRAVALTVDTSIITAAGNDFSYEDIFSRQVEALVTSKDIFMGITTSGNSPNILKCFEVCQKVGAKSILLSGKDGGKAVQNKMADFNLVVPGPNTARIQEVHEILYHTICLVLEKKLIQDGFIHYRT